jgi:hypothetical protein
MKKMTNLDHGLDAAALMQAFLTGDRAGAGIILEHADPRGLITELSIAFLTLLDSLTDGDNAEAIGYIDSWREYVINVGKAGR